MAAVILVTMTAVRITTTVPARVGMHPTITILLNGWAVVYAAMLLKLAVSPDRITHVAAMPIGVLVFGAHASMFVALWADGEAPAGNIPERLMLTATVVIYHLWGIWSDRRAN